MGGHSDCGDVGFIIICILRGIRLLSFIYIQLSITLSTLWSGSRIVAEVPVASHTLELVDSLLITNEFEFSLRICKLRIFCIYLYGRSRLENQCTTLTLRSIGSSNLTRQYYPNEANQKVRAQHLIQL